FALVLVIFVIALISLLGIALSMSLQSHVRLASNRVSSSQAEAMADGGVQLAVLSLITDSRSRVPQWRFPIDGQPVTCSANGARL
ncbi:hypothetical protein ABTM61_19910, partial [Acinetobacter baumannii]